MAISRVLEGLYKNGKVYRKKGRARELLAKGKKGLFEGQDIFFGKGKARVLSCRLPLLPLGDGEGSIDVISLVLARKFQTG